MTVTNNGPSAAADVALADALPAGLVPVSAVVVPWHVHGGGGR